MFALILCFVSSLPLSVSGDPVIFLGTSRLLLSLPSFYPSTTVLPSHPIGHGLNGAVAELISDHLVVCGGYNGQVTNLASCHALVEGEWVKRPSLATERVHAAASFNNLGQWMISGGQDNQMDLLQSTEVMHSDGVWGPGPDMVGGSRMEHCQVTTDLGILVIGGFNYNTRVKDSVILLAPNSMTWVPTTSMKYRRQTMACVLFEDEVWVMGGFQDMKGFLSTTEVFSLSTKTWRDGPELPYAVNWGQALVYEGDLYHIGGIHSGGQVLRLDGDFWEAVSSTAYDDVRDSYQAVVMKEGCTDC